MRELSVPLTEIAIWVFKAPDGNAYSACEKRWFDARTSAARMARADPQSLLLVKSPFDPR